MEQKYLIYFLVILIGFGSLGFVYSIQNTETPTVSAPPGNNQGGEGSPSNNTTVNGTILVSESSQNLVLVRNITTNNSTGNNITVNNSSVNQPTPVTGVNILQVTPSGSIPHIVEISDGISTQQYYAYCVEPTQKAQSGASLTPDGVEQSAVVLKTIKDSNPSNEDSATSAQMKIWVLVSGGSTDPSIGEGSSYANEMSSSELQSELNQAKKDIMDEYNVTEDQIGNLVKYKPVDIAGTAIISNVALSVQDSLNLNTKNAGLNNTNNTTNNTTINNTTNINVSNETNVTTETMQNTSTNQQTSNSSSGSIVYMILEFLRL